MACSICFHDFGGQRRGYCASCVRATLYISRTRQVAALLQREKSQAHVEAIVRPGNDGVLAALPQDADWDTITHGIRSNTLRHQKIALDAEHERLTNITNQAAVLQRQMIEYRNQIEAKKRANAQRRAANERRRAELEEIKLSVAEPLDTTFRKLSSRLQRMSSRTADARAGLCYTASWLAGISQETDSRRRPTGRIYLSKVVIPDLRAFNGPVLHKANAASSQPGEMAQHHQINASLDNVCRMIATWSFYLSISVPAEIILPHEDFPHSAIMPEKASYRRQDIPYPAGRGSQTNSPVASRILQEIPNAPRPRLLHLDRPISDLAKEEPKAFGLFVEGVILLAWDLAWLCKTQGITAINTFDELCDVGRNMWLLHRAAEARIVDAQQQTQANQRRKETGQQFGVLTHGSVSHSLAGHEGAGTMQNWRLAQPHRLVDKLRAYLLAEMSGAEWDVLSDKDFDDEHEDEIAVLVGGRRTRAEKLSTMSVMSIAEGSSAKPAKGWMKVRGREADD